MVKLSYLAMLCLLYFSEIGHAVSAIGHPEQQFLKRVSESPSPLNYFTVFGKKEFIRSLRWNENGLSGFSPEVPLRELTAEQLIELYDFLEISTYLPTSLPKTPPLRLDAPSTQLQHFWKVLLDKLDNQIELQPVHDIGSTANASKAIMEYYSQTFSAVLQQNLLTEIPAEDLLLYFNSANTLVFYFADYHAYQQQRQIFDELQRRNINTDRHFKPTIVRSAQRMRDFDYLKTLLKDFPELGPIALPAIINNIAADDTRLQLLHFNSGNWHNTILNLNDKPTILLVISESCMFSKQALIDISADKVLLAELNKVQFLIIPNLSDADPFTYMQHILADKPELPIYIPYNLAIWQQFTFNSVPLFLIFDKGTLQHSFSGWPVDGNKAALQQALSQLTNHALTSR